MKSPYERGEFFQHPQEIWNEKECSKRARSAPKDHWGNRPPKGLINHTGSTYHERGKTTRYNGGCIREGEHYQGEITPLPSIPEGWEIVPLSSWGMVIRKIAK